MVGAPFMRPHQFFLVVPYNFLSTNIGTKSEPKFCDIRAFSKEMPISLFLGYCLRIGLNSSFKINNGEHHLLY